MKVMWKAACAAVLLTAALTIEIGCGDTYRPIATPLPTPPGQSAQPSGTETDVVLSQCPSGITCTSLGSQLTAIDVSGDTNMGNHTLANLVGNVTGGSIVAGTTASPMAFDGSRSTVFTANTATDSVTQSSINASTAGFSTTTTTISLPAGSAPIGISFEYSGTYTQDYVVNSGTKTTNCSGTGSLGVITQAATAVLKTSICVGADPVFAWIYWDQTKVFVLDQSESMVYVVRPNANTPSQPNKIALGAGRAPIKISQSSSGQYLYVLNSGTGTISVIDGQAEQLVGEVSPQVNKNCGAICDSPLVDIAQGQNYSDKTTNTQLDHIWLLHANGTVSVWDGTSVAVSNTLTWMTSLSTGPNPTNLALMRDGTMAYVGLGGTDQIVAIDTTKIAKTGSLTTNATNATTSITVGVHRSFSPSSNVVTDDSGTVFQVGENTTPTVNYVAVSRGGNNAELSKAYASTTTSTTYSYYDVKGNATNNRPSSDATPAWCADSGNTTVCANLYNGTAVVTAAASAEVNGTTPVPINTYVLTIAAPSQQTYCTPLTGVPDAQKACPLMVPQMVLGRN
jgi:hypothetical protein